MSRRPDYVQNLNRIKNSISAILDSLEVLQTKEGLLTEEENELIARLETDVDDKARYLCILTSGFLEISIREIIEDHFFQCAPNASEYVSSTWPKSKNMWFDVIVSVIKNINREKSITFKENNQSDYKDSIDNIVRTRNKISHGVTVTLVAGDVVGWLEKAIDLIDNFEACIQDLPITV